MKCKCSLNNNYEVIGLCDIEKYNRKISGFTDNSWTQLTIPEKSELPTNKPSIKTVTKVYLDIKITSTKIIKTPTSNMPNIRGLSLTGKILLVSGYICQNILYVSESLSNSMHSVKFKNSFSTYIVIEEDVDIDNDNYCVYPCVEDVYVTPLNERTLSKSVTLFLFAHQTTKTLIDNAFIFKTSDTDEEMAKIEFDGNTKKLVVTSTNANYNDRTAAGKDVFIFKITNLNATVSNSSTIQETGDATNFKNQLNDVRFRFGDVIVLDFKDSSKVSLTNYPVSGSDYSMVGKNVQSFKVTRNGIVPYVLPNDIILNGSANQPVVTVQFDIFSKSLLIDSTGNNSGTGSQNYFKLTILQPDGMTQKITSRIAGASTGANFKTDLNNQHFEFNDVLKLEYEDSTKVIVTNLPDANTPIYNPSGISQQFRIIETGLVSLGAPITKLPNIFIFKTFDTDEEMARVEFNLLTRKLVVLSNGKNYNNPLSSGREVFSFRLIDLDTSTATRSTINGDQNADNFKNELNDLDFEIDYVITVGFKDNTKVFLTNFPTMGNNYSMVATNLQSFKITPDRITQYIIQNEVILNGANNQPVIIMQFDILAKTILVTSTGNGTGAGGANYFKATLFASDGTTQKASSFISGNSNGSVFKQDLNSQRFALENFARLDDILLLEYEDRTKVVVTNFPDTNTPIYNPTVNSQRFRIVETGFINV